MTIPIPGILFIVACFSLLSVIITYHWCRRCEYIRTAAKAQALTERLTDWAYWQASEFPQFASCAKLAAGQIFRWQQSEAACNPDAWPKLQPSDSVRRDLRQQFTPAPGSKTMT